MGIRLSPLALVAFGALAALAGCSSSAGSYSSVPPAQGLQRSITPDNYFNRLYIADATAKLDILDNSFNWVNAIYGTTPCPSGAWINRTGPPRLYVADFGCNGQIGVTEYKSLTLPPVYATPWFTYTASLVDPIDVTTDNANDVIVADNGGSQVVEYAQAEPHRFASLHDSICRRGCRRCKRRRLRLGAAAHANRQVPRPRRAQ